MIFYLVMGSRSAVWHNQGINEAPKTRRQGILGGFVTRRTEELVERPLDPAPIRPQHFMAIRPSGRMLKGEINNQRYLWNECR